MASASVGSSSSLSRMTWKPNWLSTGSVGTPTSGCGEGRRQRRGRRPPEQSSRGRLPAPRSRCRSTPRRQAVAKSSPASIRVEDVIGLLLGRNQDVRRAIEFASAAVIRCVDLLLGGLLRHRPARFSLISPTSSWLWANCCNSSSVICCASRNSSRVWPFADSSKSAVASAVMSSSGITIPNSVSAALGDDLLLDEESEGSGEVWLRGSQPRHRTIRASTSATVMSVAVDGCCHTAAAAAASTCGEGDGGNDQE